MSVAAVTMARRLTEPFARGGDTLELRLSAGRDGANAVVEEYGFAEHVARFDRQPDPRYVLVCRRDVAVDTTVTVTWDGGSARVAVPAGSVAGTSFAIGLGTPPPEPPPRPILKGLTTSPPDAEGAPADAWGLTALLGTIAKLLWVGGWERDRVRRELTRVVAQRHRAEALGRGLDLLGHDLGVPRFVPHAYAFDDAALALLHLDDPVRPEPGKPDAEDRLARYRPVAHHGRNTGGFARPAAPGRFGGAFAFRDPRAELTIDDHPELALAAGRSFTVECFFRPDPDADGHVVSKQLRPGATNDAGWALTLGEFGRGLDRNVRWQLCDGSARRVVALFADVTVTGDRFHHLAGSVDRAAGEARLHVDGELRASAPLGRLGALTSRADVRVGRHGGAGAAGLVDELRLSAVARTRFDPVLGESDDSYRRRLGVFERWTLPSPSGVQAALNAAVGEIGGDPEPLEVDDTPATLAAGAAPVRLEPVRLAAGTHIDALGRRRTSEPEAIGAVEDEELRLGSAWLATSTDARADYAPAPARELEPGEEAPRSSLMHARAKAALRALLDALAARGAAGRLLVRSAFDPRGEDAGAQGSTLLLDAPGLERGRLAAAARAAGYDYVRDRGEVGGVVVSVAAASAADTLAALRAALGAEGAPGRLRVEPAFGPRREDARAVGRTLLLDHPRVARAELAAAAHVAGFDYVSHRADLRAVVASVRAAERLAIAVTATAGPAVGSGVDGTVGEPLLLSVDQPLPTDARVEWITIPCGAGRADVESLPAEPLASLRATASGVLTVRVEVTWRGLRTAATRTLRIGPRDLADGDSIGADGRLGAPASVADDAGPPPFLHPVHLLHVEDDRIAFDAGDRSHRMQRGTAARLERLADLLEAGGGPGRLRVHEAWDPAGRDLRARGRRLLLGHERLDSGALAARAHAAGFAWVARTGTRVEARHGEEELLAVSALSRLAEGAAARVSIVQRADAQAVAVTPTAVYVASAGTDAVSELDPATGAVRRAFKVGHRPVALAVDPSGRRLYTADAGSATVSVVDLAAGTLLAPLAVGARPSELLHHPSLQRLYVGCAGDATVRVIDTARATQIAQSAIEAGSPRLALSRDGRRVWIACDGSAVVRIHPAEPFGPASAQVTLPEPPSAFALAAGSDRGWIALPRASRVALVRQDAPALTGEVGVSAPPAELALADGDAALYVLGRDGEIAVGLALDAAGVEQSRFPLPRRSGRLTAAGAGRRLFATVPDLGVAVLERGARGAVAQVGAWRLGTGLGEETTWIARPFGEGRGAFRNASRPDTELRAERAGPLLLRAVASLGDHGPPYTFEVRLKASLERARARIRKDQYDLLMNVLNLLHPIGVEVRTRRIRERVLEVSDGLLEAFPDYTYPNFRVTGPSPVPSGQEE